MANPPPSRPDPDPDSGTERDRQLARYAAELADAVDAALASWVRRTVTDRCAQSGTGWTPELSATTDQAAGMCVTVVGAEVRALLEQDLDDQRTTPLTLLRGAVRYPTSVLAGAGVPAVRRDEFRERTFPDDPYDLTPAAFRDIDESLHEPGLVWGAAKAHVHLARRRDEGRR